MSESTPPSGSAPLEFPKDQWPAIRDLAQSGGPSAVIARLAAETDPLRRRKLAMFATGQLAWESWTGKTLDGMAKVLQWAIDDALAQAAAEIDPEQAARRTDLANMLSYNLTSKLADCWSDDTEPREPRHFELGLQTAERCLAWREQLSKGSWPFSAAWWAKGMHQLSLGRAAEAVQSFKLSRDYAVTLARESGDPDPRSARHFGIALADGYCGIAEVVTGNDDIRYSGAIKAFEAMARDPDLREDAELGLDQLRTVWARYVAGGTPTE